MYHTLSVNPTVTLGFILFLPSIIFNSIVIAYKIEDIVSKHNNNNQIV